MSSVGPVSSIIKETLLLGLGRYPRKFLWNSFAVISYMDLNRGTRYNAGADQDL